MSSSAQYGRDHGSAGTHSIAQCQTQYFSQFFSPTVNALLAVIALYQTAILIPLFGYYYYYNPWGLSDPEMVLTGPDHGVHHPGVGGTGERLQLPLRLPVAV